MTIPEGDSSVLRIALRAGRAPVLLPVFDDALRVPVPPAAHAAAGVAVAGVRALAGRQRLVASFATSSHGLVLALRSAAVAWAWWRLAEWDAGPVRMAAIGDGAQVMGFDFMVEHGGR